jgi:hypothetical protein
VFDLVLLRRNVCVNAHSQTPLNARIPIYANPWYIRKQKRRLMLCARCERSHKRRVMRGCSTTNRLNASQCKCFDVVPPPYTRTPSTHTVSLPACHNLDLSATSILALDLDLVDDLRRSAPSLAFLRRSTGLSSSSDSSTVKRSGLGSRHEWR